MVVVQFDVADDQILILWRESRECRQVARFEIASHLLIERRGHGIDRIHGRVRAASRKSAVLVANAIADRFGEICGERGGLREIERAKPRQHTRDGVVHHVRGIGGAPHPAGQLTMGDAVQPRKIAMEQPAERVRIPEPGLCEKMPGRCGHRRVSRLSRRHAGLRSRR